MLHLHILDVGHGDSILLHLPECEGDKGERWGLVDCQMAQGRREPPALKQLKKRPLMRGQLQFLCLTHPHEDHFTGMSKVIAYFKRGKKVREFWFSAPHSCFDVAYNRRAPNMKPAFRELRKISDHTLYAKKRRNAFPKLRQLQEGTLRRIHPDVVVRVLSPDSGTVGELGRLASRAQEDPSKNRFPTQILNQASMVLQLEYGRVRILLCADAEAENWNCILAAADEKQYDLKSSVVKAAHHGSKLKKDQAFHEDLWQKIQHPSGTAVVVSCGTRYGHPSQEVVRVITHHASFIACTGVAVPSLAFGGWPAEVPTASPSMLHNLTLPVCPTCGGAADGTCVVSATEQGRVTVKTQSGRTWDLQL